MSDSTKTTETNITETNITETSDSTKARKSRNPFRRAHQFAVENDLYAPILMIGAAGISLVTVVLSAKDTQAWLSGLDRLETLDENGTMLLVSNELSDEITDEATEE